MKGGRLSNKKDSLFFYLNLYYETIIRIFILSLQN